MDIIFGMENIRLRKAISQELLKYINKDGSLTVDEFSFSFNGKTVLVRSINSIDLVVQNGKPYYKDGRPFFKPRFSVINWILNKLGIRNESANSI